MCRGRQGGKDASSLRNLNARLRNLCFLNMKVVSQKLYFRDIDLIGC